MGYLGIGKRPHHVHRGLKFADAAKCRSTEALTLARALAEPGDVDDLHLCAHPVGNVLHVRDGVDTRVGHVGDAAVGLARGERVRRNLGLSTCHQVEEGGLTGVRESYEPELQVRNPRRSPGGSWPHRAAHA